MCPRSSIPRVISMLRYTPSRSSRSSPASLTSLSEPTGSASRAIAIGPNSNDWGYSPTVGKAGDWLREERRKTLGDWVAFCVSCGFTQRYFEQGAQQLPASCPGCGGEFRSQCPACGERFSSAFAVECDRCRGALRPRELLGTPSRRPSKN